MKAKTQPNNASSALAQLKKDGFSKIELEFDGSGDDGSVTAIRGYKLDAAQAEHVLATSEKRWIDIKYEQYGPIFDRLVDAIPIDWYNNDGGYGTIAVDLDDDGVHIDYAQRIMSAETGEVSLDISELAKDGVVYQ